jgi:ribosomal protein S18 acetylase RimI-like enzyme
MEIRLYRESDEAAVIGLWRAVFNYNLPHHNPAASIRKKVAFQPELFFVATEGGEVTGTVMGGYDGHRGWIYSLAVAPSLQRKGTGTALVRHVERVLGELGCPKINLQVLAENAGVVAFYQKLGYRVEERVSMGKPLVRA